MDFEAILCSVGSIRIWYDVMQCYGPEARPALAVDGPGQVYWVRCSLELSGTWSVKEIAQSGQPYPGQSLLIDAVSSSFMGWFFEETVLSS